MKKIILFSHIIILILTCACSSQSPKKMPEAKNGVIDLNNWDFQNDGIVDLNGEWEFYWNKHDTPKNFLNEQIFPKYYNVPALWNSEEFNDTSLPDTGIATYRLKILLNEPSKKLALMVNKINTSYALYINDTKVFESGKIGKNIKNTKPWDIPTVIDLKAESDIVYLTFLVSNFHISGGGIGEKIQICSEDEINKCFKKKIYATLFILGIIFIMGLYNLSIFIIIRNYKSLLFLGINCIIAGLFFGLSNERILFTIFSGLPWAFLYTLLSISFYLSIPSFSLFTHSLFPQEFNKTFLKIIIIIGSIFAILALFNNIKINNFLMITNQVATLLIGIYTINTLVKAAIKKREGSIIFLTTGTIFFFMIINDILNHNQIIHTCSIVKYGFAILIFSLSYTVTFKFSKAFFEADGLSKELNYFKGELEEKIQLRTDELNNTRKELSLKNKTLADTNEELKKVNEILWDEMEVENKIRTSLHSKNQKINGFEILTYTYPEKKLGGNYHDIIHTKNKDWIIIYDVSSSGIKSGLIMLMVQTSIRVMLSIEQDIEPIELVAKINDLIGKNILILNDEKYIKLTLLDIDKMNDHQVTGFHHDLFIYRQSSEKVDVIKSNEAWLGITDDVKNFLENDLFSIESNDVIVLFSYSASDLWDKKNIKKNKDPNIEKISTDKINNILSKNAKDKLENIYDALVKEIEKLAHNDNVTLIILKKE